MTKILPASASDLDALYAISLKTGDMGADATALYDDPQMIGHIYSAPYLLYSPGLCFVVEDQDGVAGYIVGVADTRTFEATLEAAWWPDLRRRYVNPADIPSADWNEDQYRANAIHSPFIIPDSIVADYPAHLHMNLLPRLQRQGWGSRLLTTWLTSARAQGVEAVHLGAGRANEAGVRFWMKSGFQDLGITDKTSRTIWLGQNLTS